MPVRVAPVKCNRPKLLFVMARVSVQMPVPPVIPTISPVMAVSPAAAPARSEAVG